MFGRLIKEAERQTDVNGRLILAVIMQESLGNPFAFRFEPKFFDKYLKGKELTKLGGHVPTNCTGATELAARGFSWGLMQIMGQTAREFGFDSDFLSALLDPRSNIELGAKILKYHLKNTDSVEAALLKYNGGGNKKYPQMVFEHLDNRTGELFLL